MNTSRGCLALLLALGCTGPAVQTIRYAEAGNSASPAGCAVRIMREMPDASRRCTPVGDVYVGDTGWSGRCGTAAVREHVKSAACELSGNAAYLRNVNDSMSSCAQTRAIVYRCPAVRTEDKASGEGNSSGEDTLTEKGKR